jgi:hypothetical protein
MNIEERKAALAQVRLATEEWRTTIDRFQRLAAALENAAGANIVKGAAEDLRRARRKAVSLARGAQQRVDAVVAGERGEPGSGPPLPLDGPRAPERRPPPLPGTPSGQEDRPGPTPAPRR